MTRLRIEQLTIYPVKSLRGIQVDSWPITAEGLLYDRYWMLVMPNGRFVTQRQLPRMALINTRIDGDDLILSAENKGEVRLPLQTAVKSQQDTFTANIWRDECEVVEAAEEASAWLNQALRPPQPLRLVAMVSQHQRVQSQPERFGKETHTRFADAAPFLIANTASLDALNRALKDKTMSAVDMRRFRPNIVVSGVESFAEHDLSKLQRQDGLTLQMRDHCERCIMTTIDPDTGEKSVDMEPYHTLAELNPMPGNSKAAAFAVNATLASQGSNNPMLQVGDTLQSEDIGP